MTKQAYVGYFKIVFLVLLFTAIVALFAVLQYYSSEYRYRLSVDALSGTYISRTVVVDAGHGGRDGGAVGKSGVLEKDINLAISENLGDFLSLCSLDVQFTRKTDVMLYNEGQENRKKYYDLYNRVEFAKQFENPVFISIHQNNFPTEKYHGLQVYYSKNNGSSALLAKHIQEKTSKYLQKDNNRKIKEAGNNIFVLKNIDCPAVIVECGFLSNHEDEKNLNDEEYRKKLAFVIFSALLDYINDENARAYNEV